MTHSLNLIKTKTIKFKLLKSSKSKNKFLKFNYQNPIIIIPTLNYYITHQNYYYQHFIIIKIRQLIKINQ